MALGDLVVKLSADIATFQSDLGKAVQLSQTQSTAIVNAFAKVKQTIATIGAGLTVHALASFIDDTIKAADRLNDLRTRTGATGQELIVLEGAALRGGVAFEAISDVTSKLGKRLQEASTGSGDAANAFAALGIKVTDGNGKLKSVNDILKESGVKFAQFEDGSNKSALALAAFGKGGDKLIPVIEGIADTEARFKKLGITISEDVITAADKFKDTMEDVRSLNEAQARDLLANLLPTLQILVDRYIALKKESTLLADVGKTLNFILEKSFQLVLLGAAGFIAYAKAVAISAQALKDVASGNFTAALTNFMANTKELGSDFKKQVDIALGSFDQLSDAMSRADKDNEDQLGKPGRTAAPRIVDVSKINAAAKEEADQVLKLNKQVAASQLAIDKELGAQRLKLLETYNSESLISIKDYYALRITVAQQSLEQELKDIDAQITAETNRQNQARKAPFSDTTNKTIVDAEKEIIKLLGDRQAIQIKAAGEFAVLGLQNKKIEDDLAASVANVNAQIANIKGNTVAAALSQFDESNRQRRQSFVANFGADSEQVKQLDNLRNLTEQQAKFNRAKEDYDAVNARLAIEEERIQNSLRTGAISELDALVQTGNARKSVSSELEKQLVLLNQIAAASDNPKLVLQVEQMRVAVQKLRSESELLAEKFDTTFKDSVSSAFADFASGTKTASEALKSFVSTFSRAIIDLGAKSLVSDLGKSLGLTGQGSGGGIGGLLAGIFGSGASKEGVYGPTQSGGNIAGDVGILASLGGLFSKFIGSFDVGTPYVPQTGLALIHQGERIVTASENAGGGSGMRLTQIFQIPAGASRQSQEQIATLAGLGVQRALSRNT